MSSNNKGCNPFSGCIVTIAGGFTLTTLLIAAIDSCDALGEKASKIAAEGLMKLFMVGCFYVVCFALFYNRD